MMNFANNRRDKTPAAEEREDDLFSAVERKYDADDSVESSTISGSGSDFSETEAPRVVHKVPMPRENAVPHRRRRGAKEEYSEDDKLETSEALREARLNAGMSLDAVRDTTRIQMHYLQALEEGNFDELPQAVYVLAYLRRLCQLYSISAEDEERLVRPWMDLQCDIPENLSASVYSDPDNENRRIVRRLEIGLFSGAAIVVIGLIVFAVILISSTVGGREEEDIVFDENILLELQDKPVLKAPAAQER